MLESFNSSWLLWIRLQWTWQYEYICKVLFWIRFVPGVGLLDHTIVPCLIFGETSVLFSTEAWPHFTFLPTGHMNSDFSASSTSLVIFHFFPLIMAIPLGVRWYLIVVLILRLCWVMFTQYLFIWLLACLLWRNVCLSPLPVFPGKEGFHCLILLNSQ